MTTPTHSEFARLEDRIDEGIEKQLARFEGKLDEVARAVERLTRFEERQAQQSTRLLELAGVVDRQKEATEARAAAMAERFDARQTSLATRFDARITDLEKQLQQLQREMQRYLGVLAGATLLVGATWAVGSKFIH